MQNNSLYYKSSGVCKHGHVDPLRYRSSNACVECNKIRTKNWQKNNAAYRAKRDTYKRLYHYGLTEEQYQALLRAQKERCAICGTDKQFRRQEDNRRLAVDHCHTTGKIRGLLCASCNRGLGYFADNPVFLRAAAKYLDKNKGD